MFQGSAHVGSGQHIGLMQAAGASVNATTWFDRTNYFETLPTGGLDLALWLEADRMGTLLEALTQQSLDNQREVVKEEKRQRYDNVPYGDVMLRLIQLTFPTDHPYGHSTIGSMADLDAATLDDVRSFFAAHYLPNNAVLSIVGDVDADTAFAAAETYFGPLPSGPPPADPDETPLPPLTGLPREDTTADVPADAVYLTWRLPAVGTPAFDAVDLAFSILGHGQTSRIYRRLVHNEEIAETASASTMGLIGGTSFGIASARARAGTAIKQVEETLVAEVERLGTDGPTPAELQRAKAQYERHWLHELARIDSRADAFGEFATLQGDPGLVNTPDRGAGRGHPGRCRRRRQRRDGQRPTRYPHLPAGEPMTTLPQPAIAAPGRWAFPTPTRSVLDNGLQVVVYPLPGQYVISGHLVLDVPLSAGGAGGGGRGDHRGPHPR